jgi:hypothetical protein
MGEASPKKTEYERLREQAERVNIVLPESNIPDDPMLPSVFNQLEHISESLSTSKEFLYDIAEVLSESLQLHVRIYDCLRRIERILEQKG